eukprot:GEMP01145753.1.p1 GENE.GEMP01145753.1~~GEMP01145753.1.p1  ORF type:complete len:109 (-),score=0.89 GEMP01145753.1:24-350(-)
MSSIRTLYSATCHVNNTQVVRSRFRRVMSYIVLTPFSRTIRDEKIEPIQLTLHRRVLSSFFLYIHFFRSPPHKKGINLKITKFDLSFRTRARQKLKQQKRYVFGVGSP